MDEWKTASEQVFSSGSVPSQMGRFRAVLKVAEGAKANKLDPGLAESMILLNQLMRGELPKPTALNKYLKYKG
jgi:hypothetical protein